MFASFGTLLKMIRKQKKLSQYQLAKKVGVHSNTISGWECGNNLPDSKGIVLEIAQQLHLDDQETRQLLEASLTALSPHWHVPYARNPFFTGREKILQQLHEALTPECPALLSQSCALSGLGGIGKTQTALEYAYRYANEYTAVFWISAETRESIFSSYIAIADMLNLPGRQEQTPEKVVTIVTHWLTTHSGWFIIFDNVEAPILVKEILPSARSGSSLFTSRRQALGIEVQALALEPMLPEEGIYFLLHRAKCFDSRTSLDSLSLTEKTLAQEIVSAMGGLPLALDQAGAYIEATQCSLSNYLQLFHSSHLHLLNTRDAHMNHPLSVTRTFLLTFEQIERSNALAADMLTVCAFLAPEAIPEIFFTEGAPFLGPQLERVGTDPLVFQEAIKTLLSYSLIQRHSRTETLTIHRLVQVVLKGHLSEASTSLWLGRILQTTSRIFPADEEIQGGPLGICEQLLPHALLCITLWEQWKEDEIQYIHFLNHIATYLMTRAQYVEAKSLFQRALSVGDTVLGPLHPMIAFLLQGLADISREQEGYAEAESLYIRALEIWEQTQDSEYLYLTKLLTKLGVLYWTQGKYDKAESCYQQVLFLFEQQLDSEHLQIASCLTNMGLLFKDQGRDAEAEPHLQRALHIREKHLGPEHPQVAYPLTCLANLFKDQGRDAEAESLYLRALHIREQHLGPEHPQVAYPLNNLAELYTNQGKYIQAEPLYLRALHIFEQQWGEEHSLIAYPLDGLAGLYSKCGNYIQAKLLYQRALSIFEKQLGQEHLNTAMVVDHLAQLQERQGNNKEARNGYTHALTIYEKVLGMHHPTTMETRQRLSGV